MFCQKCGSQIQNGERFCRSCGNFVEGGNIPTRPMNSVQSNNAPKSNYAVKPNPQYANYAVNTVKAKKPINKKKLISIIISVIVIIAIASGGIFTLISYMKEAPSRDMKKALESKDIYQVLEVIDEHGYKKDLIRTNAEKLTAPIKEYVQDAIDTLNSDFELDLSRVSDKSDIEEEIYSFMCERFGTIFYVDGEKSPIWHLEDYIPYYDPNISFGGSLLDLSGNIISSSDGSSVKIELENLNSAMESKADYYYDLYVSE